MEKSRFDDYIVSTACSRCSREFNRTLAWFRIHDAIVCPCGGRIHLRYETLMGMLTPGEVGMDVMQKDVEAALKEIGDELQDYARDHPSLGDQELKRHAYEALTNQLGHEYVSISPGGHVGFEVAFDED